MYSSEDTFNKWRDNFNGEIFFSPGTESSCGVMIGYLGNKKAPQRCQWRRSGVFVCFGHVSHYLLFPFLALGM